MKRILLGFSAMLIMASCSSNGGENSNNTDSVATIDTITSQDANIQQEEVKSVQPKEGDNVKTKEADLKPEKESTVSKSLTAVLPDPKKLIKTNNPTKYLKSLGFKGSTKEVPTEYDGDKLVGKYSYSDGGKSINVRWENLMGSSEWDVTIQNDDQALEEFYSNAKKQQAKGSYWEVKVKKSGNTVKIISNSD